MSHNKKNIYAQKAKQKSLMGLMSASDSETKHDVKKTLAYTGRDIIFGGIGGALVGALAGRSSFLLGIAVAGTGHFLGSPSAALFGVGMMASGGYQTFSGAFNGVEKEGMEGVKERFANFQENLKRQLFLDKIMPAKKTEDAPKTETTNGVEQVQYFNHQDSNNVNGLDFTEANKLEEQIRQSAREFEAKNSGEFSGAEEDVSGVDGIEERLL